MVSADFSQAKCRHECRHGSDGSCTVMPTHAGAAQASAGRRIITTISGDGGSRSSQVPAVGRELDRLSKQASPARRNAGYPRASTDLAIVSETGSSQLRDERQAPSHRLDRFAKCGQKEIAALFETRHAVLVDAEFLGFRARRNSLKVICSAISSAPRASTFLRCPAANFLILSFTFTTIGCRPRWSIALKNR